MNVVAGGSPSQPVRGPGARGARPSWSKQRPQEAAPLQVQPLVLVLRVLEQEQEQAQAQALRPIPLRSAPSSAV